VSVPRARPLPTPPAPPDGGLSWTAVSTPFGEIVIGGPPFVTPEDVADLVGAAWDRLLRRHVHAASLSDAVEGLRADLVEAGLCVPRLVRLTVWRDRHYAAVGLSHAAGSPATRRTPLVVAFTTATFRDPLWCVFAPARCPMTRVLDAVAATVAPFVDRPAAPPNDDAPTVPELADRCAAALTARRWPSAALSVPVVFGVGLSGSVHAQPVRRGTPRPWVGSS
jgi:hypothetical protein